MPFSPNLRAASPLFHQHRIQPIIIPQRPLQSTIPAIFLLYIIPSFPNINHLLSITSIKENHFWVPPPPVNSKIIVNILSVPIPLSSTYTFQIPYWHSISSHSTIVHLNIFLTPLPFKAEHISWQKYRRRIFYSYKAPSTYVYNNFDPNSIFPIFDII